MENVTHRLGIAVRHHRNRLGLSQEELAFRSRLHRTYISDIERGARNPSVDSVAKLAEALDVSLSDLFSTLPAATPAGQIPAGEILLVEDNAHDTELAIRALKSFNVTNPILIASNGAEALDFLYPRTTGSKDDKYRHICVVLLDLDLPRITGLEVLRRMRGHPHTENLPVVVLTASRLEQDCEYFRRLGIKDYIIKPVDFEQFSRAMLRLGLYWILHNRQDTRR